MSKIIGIFQRLKLHWHVYRNANRKLKWPRFNYVVWVLLYRRLFCYVLALPLLLLYFILYPFIKFRFFRLIDSAIGHFTVNTECLLSKIDTLKDDKFINIFYLEHTLFAPPICNDYLHKKWQQVITILPLRLTGIITSLDKMLMYFLGNKSYGLWGEKAYFEKRGAVRDVYGYLKNSDVHLKFSPADHQSAKQMLERIKIKSTDKYVCLLVRSNAYNKDNLSWNSPERNADLSTYMQACNFLAKKGYFVLRMGKIVDDVFENSHPQIIDYARSEIRSDFMDIYLSAHCSFFITTGSGLDGVAQIFKRPIIFTNCHVLSYVSTWYPHYLFIPKMVESNQLKRLLTFKENVAYLCDDSEYKNPNFHLFYIHEYLQKHQLSFVDNTDDEILDAVKEMEARITTNWHETEDQHELQRKFWNIFPVKTIFRDTGRPLHGAIDVKIGSNFLLKYQHLLM